MSFLVAHKVKVTYTDFGDKIKTYSFEEYDSPLLYPRISYIVNLIKDVKYIMDINIVPDINKKVRDHPFDQLEGNHTIH
mgnify:FL=1